MRCVIKKLYILSTLYFVYGVSGEVLRRSNKKRRLVTDGINSTDPDFHIISKPLKSENVGKSISRKKNPAIPGRDTIDALRRKWPLKVPFTTEKLTSKEGNIAVRHSIRDIEDKTCITFIKRTSEVDYMNFRDGKGCFSQIGKRGGKQDIVLGEGCFSQPKAEHEIMHTLGSYHEQNRADRDKYVRVLFKNIIPKFREQFIKRTNLQPEGKYDYGSIMHYGKWSFARSKKPIMLAKMANGKRYKGDFGVLNRHGGMTSLDASTLNSYYGCDKSNSKIGLVDRVVYPG